MAGLKWIADDLRRPHLGGARHRQLLAGAGASRRHARARLSSCFARAAAWRSPRSANSETAADSLGVDGFRTKLVVYVLTAFGTGMVGALIYLQKARISPDAAFSVLDWTAYVIFIVVIGGIGTIEGPIIGAIVLYLLQDYLATFGAWYLMLLGALAIVVMLVAPGGLWGFVAQRFDLADLSDPPLPAAEGLSQTAIQGQTSIPAEDDPMKLESKTAVITGAAERHRPRAFRRRYADEGAVRRGDGPPTSTPCRQNRRRDRPRRLWRRARRQLRGSRSQRWSRSVVARSGGHRHPRQQRRDLRHGADPRSFPRHIYACPVQHQREGPVLHVAGSRAAAMVKTAAAAARSSISRRRPAAAARRWSRCIAPPRPRSSA